MYQVLHEKNFLLAESLGIPVRTQVTAKRSNDEYWSQTMARQKEIKQRLLDDPEFFFMAEYQLCKFFKCQPEYLLSEMALSSTHRKDHPRRDRSGEKLLLIEYMATFL